MATLNARQQLRENSSDLVSIPLSRITSEGVSRDGPHIDRVSAEEIIYSNSGYWLMPSYQAISIHINQSSETDYESSGDRKA